jgi:hypothetical protein
MAANHYRHCPHCHEEIRAAALVCWHCGEDVPAESQARRAWRAVLVRFHAEQVLTARYQGTVKGFALGFAFAAFWCAGLATVAALRAPVALAPPLPHPPPTQAQINAVRWDREAAQRAREERGVYFATHPELREQAAREGFSLNLRR